jgi:hypothetical protein
MRHNDTSERNQSLWILTAAPTIWAVHFLLSYLTAATWCGMVVGREGPLSGARIAIAVYTALALAGIAVTGWIGYRRHSAGSSTVPHDFDTPEDRHRFLGFATVLLSGLSAVATIYVALAAVLLERCY